VEADATGPTKVQTDGINFPGVWAHSDLIDVDNITTNDVGSTLRMYGVEAARATLMREVRAVFGAYGIGVDPRHLGLIADFMTHMVRDLLHCMLILLALPEAPDFCAPPYRHSMHCAMPALYLACTHACFTGSASSGSVSLSSCACLIGCVGFTDAVGNCSSYVSSERQGLSIYYDCLL